MGEPVREPLARAGLLPKAKGESENLRELPNRNGIFVGKGLSSWPIKRK
ncbi:hypothetical protein IP90_03011 [Luteimonas cucumeris]|uniref:Uncharacterized protein n=1 Tax=Luteimonas cucumeris TaxID=985012 RepID=A0A562KWY3_9GAMM|nr:hypothetical protein IP90_03011 [Luteimonas cucumeris]